MKPDGSGLNIRKIHPSERSRWLGKIAAKKTGEPADKDWGPWSGLVPASLFHVPSPGLAGHVKVREPGAAYGDGPGLEERIAKEHLEPLFSLRGGIEVRDSWVARVDAFIADHVEAGRRVIERAGMERIAASLRPEDVGALAEGFAGEFESRWGVDLLDVFLFGLEIASRYGSSLARGALSGGLPGEFPRSEEGSRLARVVAGFDLGAWAILSALESPGGAGLALDAAMELVLTAKRMAAHAFGVLHRTRGEAVS